VITFDAPRNAKLCLDQQTSDSANPAQTIVGKFAAEILADNKYYLDVTLKLVISFSFTRQLIFVNKTPEENACFE
jgi:hypothetical protein